MSDNKFDLTKFDQVMADVEEAREKGNFLPDMSTKDGYNASKRYVLDVTAPMRKALENAHKETKAPFWETCKFLDSKKKELMAVIEEIEEPHKLAYRNHDAEIKRKKEEAEQAVQNKIDWFDHVINQAFSADSKRIGELMEECQDFDMDFEFFGKRIEEAQNKQVVTIAKLADRLTQQVAFEESEKQRLEMEKRQQELEEREAKLSAEEEARIAAQNAEAEAKERAEREAKLKAEREEAERKHAEEMKALKAKQEKERIEAERIAKEQAEKARIEAEEKAKREEEERIAREEAARASRTKNRNHAAKQLIELCGLTKEQAISVCNEIASNKIDFLSANF